MKSSLLAAALACLSFAALADEADVKKAVEAKLGKVEKIVKAPMAGSGKSRWTARFSTPTTRAAT
jgi:hypothetical protein